MLARELLRPLNRPEWQWLYSYILVGSFIIVASAVGLGPYSGLGTPPMYGDFEAQRHWLEITTQLSPSKWYFYDLQWWGLDYPPLTAFHSWVLGKIGGILHPEWFALDSSRGLESDGLKSYMRATALASELIFYVFFAFKYARMRAAANKTKVLNWVTNLLVFLLIPSLIIIDNGHFQYNSVMLGLFIGCLRALDTANFIEASILFVGSLLFKQMALYYAPVVFFYILGRCLFPLNIKRLASVGVTVVASILVCLIPWLTSLEQLTQVLVRVFPLNRGLWEDKVGNFWCATNTVIKYKTLFTNEQLQKLSLLGTLLAISPSCISVFLRKDPVVLLLAASCCSWAFYLFSFQVHEKSVLLPLIPSSLLLFESNKEWASMVYWMNNVSYFSMWPLLQREKLGLQYFVLGALWNYLTSFELPQFWLNKAVVSLSYMAFLGLFALEYTDSIPFVDRFPDLYVVLNVVLSFCCFAFTFLWLHVQLYYAYTTETKSSAVKKSR